MNTPGFNAEASLYMTSEQYRLSGVQTSYAGTQILPAGGCRSDDGKVICICDAGSYCKATATDCECKTTHFGEDETIMPRSSFLSR
jgi:hypothetical protein